MCNLPQTQFNYCDELTNKPATTSGGGFVSNIALHSVILINPDPNYLPLYSWFFAIFIFTGLSVYISQQLYDRYLIPQNEFYVCASFILCFIGLTALYTLTINNMKVFLSLIILFTLFASACLLNLPEDFKAQHIELYNNCQYALCIIWVLALFLCANSFWILQ